MGPEMGFRLSLENARQNQWPSERVHCFTLDSISLLAEEMRPINTSLSQWTATLSKEASIFIFDTSTPSNYPNPQMTWKWGRGGGQFWLMASQIWEIKSTGWLRLSSVPHPFGPSIGLCIVFQRIFVATHSAAHYSDKENFYHSWWSKTAKFLGVQSKKCFRVVLPKKNNKKPRRKKIKMREYLRSIWVILLLVIQFRGSDPAPYRWCRCQPPFAVPSHWRGELLGLFLTGSFSIGWH